MNYTETTERILTLARAEVEAANAKGVSRAERACRKAAAEAYLTSAELMNDARFSDTPRECGFVITSDIEPVDQQTLAERIAAAHDRARRLAPLAI